VDGLTSNTWNNQYHTTRHRSAIL